MTSRSRLLVMIFDFRKWTSGDIFWLPEVDFWWYILTFGSRLLVIYFDFRKSSSGDIFWLPEIIYFDFRKSTSRSNFGGVMSVSFLKWSKSFFGNLKKFWKGRRNAWRCRKKDPNFTPFTTRPWNLYLLAVADYIWSKEGN